MKYIAPEFATLVVDTEDIVLASAVQPEQPGDGTVTTPDDEL